MAGLDDQERDGLEMRNARAALQLALGDPEAATAILAPIRDGSASLPNAHLWDVQARLLEAIARDTLGDRAAASRALEGALDLAAPEGLVLPFLIDPAPGLLDRHRRLGTARTPFIAEVLSRLAGETAPGGRHQETVAGRGLREPLSHGETRVLRYLPTALSAPEIAGELYLSVNTVKTHMRHLYDKLGVHRRHEAVERARALGLLAPAPRTR